MRSTPPARPLPPPSCRRVAPSCDPLRSRARAGRALGRAPAERRGVFGAPSAALPRTQPRQGRRAVRACGGQAALRVHIAQAPARARTASILTPCQPDPRVEARWQCLLLWILVTPLSSGGPETLRVIAAYTPFAAHEARSSKLDRPHPRFVRLQFPNKSC